MAVAILASLCVMAEDATFVMTSIFTGSNQTAQVTSPVEATITTTSSASNIANGKLGSTGQYIEIVLNLANFSSVSFNGYINSTSTSGYDWGFQFSTDGGATWSVEQQQANDGNKTAHDIAVNVEIPEGANGFRVIRSAGTSTYVNSITLTLVDNSNRPVTSAVVSGPVFTAIGSEVKMECKARNATSYQWFGNGIAIPGAIEKEYSFIPEASGEYTFYCEAQNEYNETPVRSNEIQVKVGGVLEVTANSAMSAIHKALGDDALATVEALKVNGSINAYDIMALNNKAVALKFLDLSDADILATPNGYEYYTGYTTQDSVLTAYSFRSANVKLETLLLPKSLKSIATNACNGHSTLQSVTIQHNGPIGNSAFSSCGSLKDVTVGDGVTSIGSSAFSSCSALTDVIIGDNVTTIGESAFAGCSALRSIHIGTNVTNLGRYAFNNCRNVKKLSYNAKNCTTFGSSNYEYYSPFSIFGNECCNKTYTLDSVIVGDSVRVIPANFLQGLSGEYDNSVVVKNLVIGNHVEEIGGGSFLGYGPDSWGDYHQIKSITKLLYRGEANDWLKIRFADADANPIARSGNLYVADTLLTNLVILDDIQQIQPNTFANCKTLESVTCSNTVQQIGDNAFSGCTALKTVECGNGLHRIDQYAFYGCTALDSVVFNNGLKSISSSAFSGCSSLEHIKFPSTLQTIGDYAFQNCSGLQEVRLPSSLLSIGRQAFTGCNNVQNVYTYTVEPVSIAQETFSCWTTAMLNVPYTSRYIYWYNTQWSQFTNSQEFVDDYDYFYANGDIELGGNTGTINGDPDVDLNPGAGLTVEGDDVQTLDSVNLHGNDNNIASIIACGNLQANSLNVQLAVKANTWYFFCFPWDILVDQLQLRGRCSIQEYDGAARAQNGLGGWKKLTGNKLHKGRGYIINAEFNDTITIRILHPSFNCENAETALFSYDSENRFDAGWNLIGNPFTSYFDLDMLFQLGFTMPIITWNGSGYDTYRPGDDEYHFSPFEAFFVQASNFLSLVFGADGRETYNQSQAASANPTPRRAKATNTNRRIINLTLSNDSYTDRTRVVFNPASTMVYEDGVDAAKFISSSAALQLYTLDAQGQPYAINERPDATTEIALGYVVAESGVYTLSAPRMDTKVKIYDNELGVEVDLSQGDYTFSTSAGTNNTRFGIRLAPSIATSIDDLADEDANGPVNIYTVQGVLLYKDVNLRDVSLMSGVYLVQGKKSVNKVVIE